MSNRDAYILAGIGVVWLLWRNFKSSSTAAETNPVIKTLEDATKVVDDVIPNYPILVATPTGLRRKESVVHIPLAIKEAKYKNAPFSYPKLNQHVVAIGEPSGWEPFANYIIQKQKPGFEGTDANKYVRGFNTEAMMYDARLLGYLDSNNKYTAKAAAL